MAGLSLESLALELGRALAPLAERLREGEVRLLLAELGLPAPDAVLGAPGVGAALGAAADALDALPEALAELAAALEAGDAVAIAAAGGRAVPLVAAAAEAIDAVAAAVEAAAAGAGPGREEVEAFAAELAERLVGFALASYLERRRPVIGHVFALLGVIETTAHAATPAAPAHVRRILRFDRFGALADDPVAVLGEVYGWGTPAFDWDGLLLRLSVFLGRISPFAFVQPGPPPFLRIAVIDVGPTDDAIPGVQAALRVAGAQGLDLTLPLGDRVALTATADAALEVGAALQLLPPADVRVVPPEGEVGGRARVGLTAPHAPGAPPVVLLGVPGGSRVEARAVRVAAGADLVWDPGDRHADGALALEAALEGGRVVLDLGGGDGFLASILPGDPIELPFDLLVGWSAQDGLRIDGEAGLRTTIGLHRRLGPLRLDHVGLELSAAADALSARATLTGGAALGPITATVDAVGVGIAVRPGGGRLGPFDADSALVPPRGVGLSVAAGPVSGGGFLRFDPERAEYAGAVSLELSGVAVKAVGLLTTRLPGGAPGYSLLILISAEFAPISLGLGFTLNGVGGLIAVNRTASVPALRAGLKTGALGAVLSPPDPIANAPQVIAALSGLFPPAAGRHVIGPVARIGWGSPTLITIDVAVLLELPAPVRLVILGRLRAVLPDEQAALVVLQMDLLGVIDVDRREAAVDATLVDSRLASFALTGDMAMRLAWGPQPSFLLAVGGFNPRFAPPPGFPALDRVSVALAKGANPRLRLEAYLAVTSNTVQLGARVDLSARAGKFEVAGFLSFDALVVLRPLAFVVDLAAKLAVRVGGRTLLSVSLSLTLSGPEPWRARGRASFSILFFDVSFRFDVTIGEEPPPALARSVDVAPLLRAALADPRAWEAQLPAGPLVTLRAPAAGTAVRAHPLGTLAVRQRVVPLQREIERFGEDVPVGARRFAVTQAFVGTRPAATEVLEDLFAPGQFRDLTDEQKLSSPSFAAMPSGARIGTTDVEHGTPVVVEVHPEQRVVSA